jgi:hypothetical protein
MQTNRSNAGALIAGSVLIFFGLVALASRFLRMDWGFVSSIAILGFGALFFLGMLAGGRQSAALAIPGSIIGGIGLVILFESITGQWESMSYFWTLIIVFVGVGIYLMGWYGREANLKRAGGRVMKVGFILFVIFGAFFETLLFSFENLIFPVVLILLGAYLVLSRFGWFARKQVEEPSEPTIPPAS